MPVLRNTEPVLKTLKSEPEKIKMLCQSLHLAIFGSVLQRTQEAIKAQCKRWQYELGIPGAILWL